MVSKKNENFFKKLWLQKMIKLSDKNIIVHDFCGHPFTYELAQKFYTENFNVNYLFTSDDKGPKAEFSQTKCPFSDLSINLSIPKRNPLKRLFWEINYAFKLRSKLHTLNTDVLICANTPVIVLFIILFNKKFDFVWWVQDIFSEAANKLKILPAVFRGVISKFFLCIEYFISSKASKIILISNDFLEFFNKKFHNKICVIENWPCASKLNFNKLKNNSIIYAGTVGFKHGVNDIIDTIKKVNNHGYNFIFVSEGINADIVSNKFKNNKRFIKYNFLDYDTLLKLIASSKGALFVLDDSASKVSIPSKVYTYLMCKTPVLGLCSQQHHLARLVNNHSIGIINDVEKFMDILKSDSKYKVYYENVDLYSSSFKIENKFNEFLKVLKNI